MMFHHCLKAWRDPMGLSKSTPLTPHLTLPHHATPHHSTPHQTFVPIHTYSSAPSHTGCHFSRCNSPSSCHLPVARMESGKRTFISTSAVFVKRCLGTPGFLFSLPPSPLPPTVHLWRADSESFPFLFLAKRDLLEPYLLLHAGREV